MYRALIITSLAGMILGAVITPDQEFETKKMRQLELVDGMLHSENNQPIYPGSSQSALPVQHFYPTYPDHSGKSAIAVPSGYDGYLIPIAPPRQTWSSSIFSALVPLTSYALTYGAKIGVYLWDLFLLLLFGGIVTTSICTFTPFCAISFMGFGINKNQVKKKTEEKKSQFVSIEIVSFIYLVA